MTWKARPGVSSPIAYSTGIHVALPFIKLIDRFAPPAQRKYASRSMTVPLAAGAPTLTGSAHYLRNWTVRHQIN